MSPIHATLDEVTGKVKDDQLPAGLGPPAWGDVTDKPAAFPPETHSHPYEPENANIQAHVAAAHAPANAQANADITKAEIEAKLTGAIVSHSHAGGADPWTVIVLTQDFVTSQNTAQVVPGLAFAPAANKKYIFEATLLTRTATASTGPRPGLSWPAGMTDGVASVQQTSSATANVFANGNINAAVLSPVGALPNNTQSYPAFIWGIVLAGATPSGNVQVRLASETAGTNVTIKAGSVFKYREVA